MHRRAGNSGRGGEWVRASGGWEGDKRGSKRSYEGSVQDHRSEQGSRGCAAADKRRIQDERNMGERRGDLRREADGRSRWMERANALNRRDASRGQPHTWPRHDDSSMPRERR